MTNPMEDFIRESNRIEGILRDPLEAEIQATYRFLEQKTITTQDLIDFVSAVAPRAKLREFKGMNVRVGNHIPPPGGPIVVTMLEDLLERVNARRIAPYHAHIEYEALHPFMDGNGRSGRALWLWMMKSAPLGFLHTFYYQTLANSDR